MIRTLARRLAAARRRSRSLVIVAAGAAGLGILSAWSGALLAQTPPAPFSAAVAVDRPAFRIGEHIGATLTLEGADVVAAARPALGQRIGDFEVLSIQATGIGRLFGRAPRAWRLELTSFEAGSRSLDQIAIEGTTRDGRAFVSSPAPAVALTVTSPEVSADDPLEPPDPPLPVPPPSPALVWGGRALLALGVVLLGWAIGRPLWLRLSARLERSRRWRRLHRRLDAVAKGPASDADAARGQCATVVTVLREGSQFAAAGRFPDLSTTEFVAAVAGTGPGREIAPELAPVLTELDTLRFAGPAVAAADVTRTVDRARRVLTMAEAATRAEERRAS